MKALVFDRQLVGDWVKEHIPHVTTWGNEYQAIGWERNGQLIAGVVYNHFSGNDIAMHIVGKGYWATPAVLRAFFRYPFVDLECQRVTAYVASKNVKCLTLVKRLGFSLEGRLREAVPGDDLMVFGLLRHECRWTESNDGQEFRRT